MAMNDIVGKIVVLTGSGEVGYGSAGKPILGYVSKIEEKGYDLPMYDGLQQGGTFTVDSATKTVLGITEGDYVATVEWGKTFVDVPTNTTAPANGDYLVSDGSGNVKTTTSITATTPATPFQLPTNCVALGVDATAKTATIKIV